MCLITHNAQEDKFACDITRNIFKNRNQRDSHQEQFAWEGDENWLMESSGEQGLRGFQCQ